MSSKAPASTSVSKDNRQGQDGKSLLTVVPVPPAKPPSSIKITIAKAKDNKEMSPIRSQDEERPELLGSLTTQQQQRTSARVIKKLRLEPQPEKRSKRSDGASDDIPDCETPNKIEDKDLKFPTVKQRMPKALWSTDEKNLFFEALNEYGKDFDAITAYICAKMKKKGMNDVNLKTKTQVSHFYYRTWHKLSKHVHFDEKVKKVAQELYALINYGELRKKLVSVNEKTCGRLGEMVLCGSIVVRARGRNMRVRTPMCRALRRLNQISERACGSVVMGRVVILLRARSAAAWSRVQAAAHNPRVCVAAPPRAPLHDVLNALAKRWKGTMKRKLTDVDREDNEDNKLEEERELEDHLNLETDRVILQDNKPGKKLALHVGPRPTADIHLPVLVPSEQLSSQKICFSSYLERMTDTTRDNNTSKIRTPKRQRKDSTTEKDKEVETKKLKTEETEKLINIEETAIDGIELMATYKSNIEDERPSTEDEKELKSEETAEEETERDEKYKDNLERDKYMLEKDVVDRDKDMSEREKDSFSELEDDEKYNKSDTDNESDHGKNKDRKFKNLKVKFRIRPKKQGKSIYTMVMEDEKDEKDDKDDGKDERDIDVDLALRQIRKGWSVHDAGDLTIGDLYLMFGSRSKLELDYWWAEPTPPLPTPLPKVKPECDKDSNTSRIQKNEKQDKSATATLKPKQECDKDTNVNRVIKSEKQDKGADSSVEDEREKRESDTDMFSPKHTYSQDSNDGMSGDERKLDSLPSPDHKSSSTLKLVNKLINRPQPAQAPTQDGFSLLSERLKRLLGMAGNPGVGGRGARCGCGAGAGSCRPPRPAQRAAPPPPPPPSSATVFRLPPPLAPKQSVCAPPLDLSDLPVSRRGRGRADRRVVVQRLLPLLPKLPPPTTLIPVKIVPNSVTSLPKILPKPPPSSTSDLSFFYVLSESNGQFFFHDGDRKIPITQHPDKMDDTMKEECDEMNEEPSTSEVKDGSSPKTDSHDYKHEVIDDKFEATDDKLDVKDVKLCGVDEKGAEGGEGGLEGAAECSTGTWAGCLASPARLLREAEWLEDARLQDFSLSSFLAHLDTRPHPDLAVDSQLHSLMAESSVDYVAKFADLAAEVTADTDPPISTE